MIRRTAVAAVLAVAQLTAGCREQADTNAPKLPLVTGRFIEDRLALASQDVGSMAVNLVASPDGRVAYSTDLGRASAVWAIDTTTGKGTGSVDFTNAKVDPVKKRSMGLYYGLAVTADGSTVYAAQGRHETIAVLHHGPDGSLKQVGVIAAKPKDFPSGLALDARGMLYSANNAPAGTDVAFGTPASVSIYDTKSANAPADVKEVGRFTFSDTIAGTSNYPLSVAALADGSRVYVASQRDSAVYVIDASDPASPKLRGKIASGSHPIGLLLNKDQSRLFIANGHSDTISIVDTSNDRIAATVLLRPEIAADLPGATPNGLALSPDERTLYASLGDMNAIAVVDVTKASLLGYLPAGWYPTGVVASPDGKRVLVSNMKGTRERNPNPGGPFSKSAPKGEERDGYILNVINANVTTVPVPASPEQLKQQTERVLRLNKLTPHYVKAANPLGDIGLQAGKIKHVIYIVKENRTYDQVLGDLPQGNGDKSLCIFGREITPNQHALAERFVLFDNFYDCGEVSGDGWTWSTQGHANEYTIKNVPYGYSQHGRHFDYEGTIDDYPAGGFPATDLEGNPLVEDPQFANGAKAIPDVAEAPGGHIWDAALKAKLSYRNYGMFVPEAIIRRKGKRVIPENYPAVTGLQPGGHDLQGITNVDYRAFDMNYADSDAPAMFARQTGDKRFLRPRATYGKFDSPSRFAEWNREFQQMLKKDPTGEAVPNFITIRLGGDHTVGANPDKHTPRSMVADNDYAVGQFVEAVSHSPIWESTAFFIIEDDAQNGPDHVDAHRSTCYVISPWIKRGSIDHSFQNTITVLKTMECLLGLPPMSQYDAVAAPMGNWDTSPSNREPFKAILPDAELIGARNPSTNTSKPVSPEQRTMIEQSLKMDFTVADRAPADELNQIIWQTVKGPGSVMPPSPHGPKSDVVRKQKDDDDDD